ncbi:MAG: 4Fe-4S dicluster domain-containing protein [Chitinivibrionales bacterium]|nr:4Fe-4S dicluster domain-containing protein [Chitinivibrionales bacterium]MBD3357208.1 4Fe-4S dicluster domain-containing protein [Chitinivibrionales bacterium]
MLHIDQNLCTFCAGCSSVCPVAAIVVRANTSRIAETCIECGVCRRFCPVEAIADREPRESAHEV